MISRTRRGLRKIEGMTTLNSEEETLSKLTECLQNAGYAEFYSSFNPLTPSKCKWDRYVNDAPEPLKTYLEVFLLGKKIELARLRTTPIRAILEPLFGLGLLTKDSGGLIYIPDLVLRIILGIWYFCQKPQINPGVYFGEDSMALLSRLQPTPGGTCLDLCAGPGIQSLYCARFASRVVAVEINLAAAALAELNVIMNRMNNVVSIVCGDLYDQLEDCLYDNIVANPPLLPFPEGIAYPFVGHGGRDGLSVTRRILSRLPSFLSPNGTAQIIGTALSDGIELVCVPELATWAQQKQMDIIVTVLGHYDVKPNSPIFEDLVLTATLATGLDRERVTKEFSKSLHDQEADYLCPMFMHIRHGGGHLGIQDLSGNDAASFWYL